MLQPLVAAGFTKADIRRAAAERGLPVAEKPPTPCLASRVAYGVAVTPERLARIARAEEIAWSRGVADVRVRDLGDRARVEVPLDDMPLVDTPMFLEALRALGFADVEIDPRGLRSGSLLALGRPEEAQTAPGMG